MKTFAINFSKGSLPFLLMAINVPKTCLFQLFILSLLTLSPFTLYMTSIDTMKMIAGLDRVKIFMSQLR